MLTLHDFAPGDVVYIVDEINRRIEGMTVKSVATNALRFETRSGLGFECRTQCPETKLSLCGKTPVEAVKRWIDYRTRVLRHAEKQHADALNLLEDVRVHRATVTLDDQPVKGPTRDSRASRR